MQDAFAEETKGRSLTKTLKVGEVYPKEYETLEEARAWISARVERYNNTHLHFALAYMPPTEYPVESPGLLAYNGAKQ